MAEMRRPRDAAADSVAEYKQVLKAVLDNRPSGMRQRLAEALGKNRSFVSQISNPAYQVPIPARHVGLIFELCHFSAQERATFLKAYSWAHPGRLAIATEARQERKMTLTLPDLGNATRNQQLETIVYDFVHRLALLLSEGR
jgi:hypothetical protein